MQPELTGKKYDGDKPRMDLLDWDALEGLAKVLTFGAQKYDANNWRGGIAYSRITSSLVRHLAAFQRGEDIDPESGLPHIDHIGCNWMFLSYFTKRRANLDDRVFSNQTDPVATSTRCADLIEIQRDWVNKKIEFLEAQEELHNANLSR